MGDNLPYVDLGTGRTAVQVTCVGESVCVLLDNSLVKCWGYNTVGTLARGDTIHRGGSWGQMGDNLQHAFLVSSKYIMANKTMTMPAHIGV